MWPKSLSYVADELARDLNIPEAKTRTAVFDVMEQIRAGKLEAPNDAHSQQRVAVLLHSKLRGAVGQDAQTQKALLKTLLDPNGSWKIGAWYGPMTQALNVTGPVATRELIHLATALGGSEKAGLAMLRKVASMPREQFTQAAQERKGNLGLLAAATVLYNKAAYQVSKYVQGGSAALKGKTADGLKRYNDGLTNKSFTALLAASDAPVQLPKDQSQLKGSLIHMGLMLNK